MTKTAKEVAYFLNNRPLCFLSTVFSIRDFILGLALLLGVQDLAHTKLVANLEQLGGAWIYGIVFMVVALLTAGSAIADKVEWTQYGLRFQSYTWLFTCLTYLVAGNIWLALIFGFMASVPSGYLAFYYKYRVGWEPLVKWRDEFGLAR